MIELIFIVAILACSYLAFVFGHSVGGRATSAYYVMIISYISAYAQEKIPHDEFLEICAEARNKTDQSIKSGKMLQP